MELTDRSCRKLLEEMLVCPICKSELDFSANLIKCAACNLQFRQSAENYYDLLPPQFFTVRENRWEERQVEMETWYSNLINSLPDAVECFANDYKPFTLILAELSGVILDIGGGNGIVRHFLGDDAKYLVIDPSLSWLAPEWRKIATQFPCLRKIPCFIRGVGEFLPFPHNSVDVTLSFWSLNHCRDPEKILHEIFRILRPGGTSLLVLENMEPSWQDIITGIQYPNALLEKAVTVKKKLWHTIQAKPWPVDPDHILIRESNLRKWISGRFEVGWRKWIGGYLSFELRKA